MKVAISAETTVDLTKELVAEYDVKIVPFTIQLGDKTALDGEMRLRTDRFMVQIVDRHFLSFLENDRHFGRNGNIQHFILEE